MPVRVPSSLVIVALPWRSFSRRAVSRSCSSSSFSRVAMLRSRSLMLALMALVSRSIDPAAPLRALMPFWIALISASRARMIVAEAPASISLALMLARRASSSSFLASVNCPLVASCARSSSTAARAAFTSSCLASATALVI